MTAVDTKGAKRSRPPVTEQEDWDTVLRPWLESAADSLDVAGVDLDVDRVHRMTAVVAAGCSLISLSIKWG